MDETTLILPEFAGNNFFNSLGNLIMDSRMGITIPLFESGGLLQLSGYGKVVEMDMVDDPVVVSSLYPAGTLRLVKFHIQHVNQVKAGSVPIRWMISEQDEQRQLTVTKIVQESENVKSFYLSPTSIASTSTASSTTSSSTSSDLWTFKAGQHLPIQLRTPRGELLRTYSLSSSPSSGYYRISVKREPHGMASTFLHDHVRVGDSINVNKPAGDFTMKQHLNDKMDMASPTVEDGSSNNNNIQTIVLLSSGIGVTPILSMLHELVIENDSSSQKKNILWIHGTRNSKYHPFRSEVQELVAKAANRIHVSLTTHVAYSRPNLDDVLRQDYDSMGRINVKLIKSLLLQQQSTTGGGGGVDSDNTFFYMCGNGSFMAEIEDGLLQEGANSNNILYETF